jgi:hypothetical protein
MVLSLTVLCTLFEFGIINMEDGDISCITEHDILVANCLNRHVLHISMLEYLENVGPLDDNEPINE